MQRYRPPKRRGMPWWLVLAVPVLFTVMLLWPDHPTPHRHSLVFWVSGLVLVQGLVWIGPCFVAGVKRQRWSGRYTQPGWAADPTGIHEHRYWEGTRWSDFAADAGVEVDDPIDDFAARDTSAAEVVDDVVSSRWRWWLPLLAPLILIVGESIWRVTQDAGIFYGASWLVTTGGSLALAGAVTVPSFVAGMQRERVRLSRIVG